MEQLNTDERDEKCEVPDAKFERFCQELALTDCVKMRAWNVLRDFISKNEDCNNDTDNTDWYTTSVYMAVVDTSMPYGPNDPHLDKQSPPFLTLSELLKKAKMNVIRFIERMRGLRDEVIQSDAVRHHLTNVEKRYCIFSPLFHRFDREWGTVFREEESDKGDSGTMPFSQTEGPDYRKTLCWTLFLHTRETLMGESQELIHTYHLLLSCLEFIVRTTPSFQLQQPFDMLRLKSAEHLDQNGYNVGILKKLAEQFQIGFEELQTVQSSTEVFFQTLKNKNGEVDLLQLKTFYYERYKRVGDLDELQFLGHDPHLMPEQNKLMATSTLSCSDTPVTPVRAAMNTIQQLKNILSMSTDEPSEELHIYFENCATSPQTSITSRISDLKTKFVQGYTKVTGSGQTVLAGDRFQLAVRLYYRVMKTLLDMEKERLSQSDFSNLLHNDTFHRSLLACSVEIVLMTYNVSWNPSRCAMGSEDSSFGFPWILDVFKLYPYDFYKVLESFIKAEPNLTREIIKHLTIIENKILDSIAWKSDSPLFDAITKAESSGSSLPSPTKDLTNGHGCSSSAAELYLSPVKGQRARGGSPGCVVFASPRKNQGVNGIFSAESPDPKSGAPKLSHSLKMFFNKVCRLGYHRLNVLCDLLNVPKDIQHKIWTCLEFGITCMTALMKNRHLDQIIMCSVYGICKVSENEIKFKDIVKAYSSLPHSEPQTYKQALIEGSENDSIISFYNRVYMQFMKNFILQFAKPAQPNLSPVPRPVSSPLAASPVYSIPGRRNFYVSPLRESPFKSPHSPSNMTPRSKQLYSFGEGIGSAEKLKNINESLSAFKSKNIPYVTTPKSLKRLSFDNTDETNQNSPGSSQDETTIIVKKKRTNPPSAIPKPGEPVRNCYTNSSIS